MSTPASADLTPETSPRYEAARERAEQLQGLLIHLLVYAVINLGLFAIDALTGGRWWFYWPLLIWGIGVALHAMVMVVPVFSSDWADRRARKELESGPR